MNTHQLECVINCDCVLRKHVLGIYAKNELTERLANHIVRTSQSSAVAIVVNTDNTNSPGQHWFAIYIEPQIVEIFDSIKSSYSLKEV